MTLHFVIYCRIGGYSIKTRNILHSPIQEPFWTSNSLAAEKRRNRYSVVWTSSWILCTNLIPTFMTCYFLFPVVLNIWFLGSNIPVANAKESGRLNPSENFERAKHVRIVRAREWVLGLKYGQRCKHHSKRCALGLVCKANSPKGRKYCLPVREKNDLLQEAGVPCASTNPDSCGTGLFCQLDDGADTGICMPNVAMTKEDFSSPTARDFGLGRIEGGLCHRTGWEGCVKNLYCLYDESTKTSYCVKGDKERKAGESCDIEGLNDCAAGLNCLHNARSKKRYCVKPAQERGRCNHLKPCAVGLNCERSKKLKKSYCVRPAQEGDQCHRRKPCSTGLLCRRIRKTCAIRIFCRATRKSRIKYCVTRGQQPGERCNRRKNCAAGLGCRWRVCVKLAQEGEKCNWRQPCSTGLHCRMIRKICSKGRVCKASKKSRTRYCATKGQQSGERCHRRKPCSNGLTCERMKTSCTTRRSCKRLGAMNICKEPVVLDGMMPSGPTTGKTSSKGRGPSMDSMPASKTESEEQVTDSMEENVIATSYVRADEYWARSLQVFAFHTATWTKYLNEGDMCDASDDRCVDDLDCKKGICTRSKSPMKQKSPKSLNPEPKNRMTVYNLGDICPNSFARCMSPYTCQQISKRGTFYCM